MPNSIHANRLKRIRPYITFNYDLRKPLSNYAKRKIKRYFDEIDSLSAREHIIYRPRSRANLKIAQNYAGHEPGLRQIKVALIPVANADERPQIKIKKGKLQLKNKHITTDIIPFDLFELINDPEAYVADLIEDYPDETAFTTKVGERGRYEIPQGFGKEQIPARVFQLMSRYDNPDENNYFGNWLFGLQAHHFDNQADYNTYQTAKLKARERNRKKRASERAKIKRGKNRGRK